MKHESDISVKERLSYKCLIGGVLLLMSTVSFANSVLSVKPIEALEVAEQKQLQQAGLIQRDQLNNQNHFRWWIASKEPKTIQGIRVTSPAGQTVEVTQTEISHPKNCYVLMADTSGSMRQYWQSAQITIKAWVDVIPANNPIFGFAENLYNVIPMSSGLTKDEIKEKLDQVTLNGKDTQLYLAVNEALKVTKGCPSSRKHLVVFSDGDAEDKAHTLSEVVNLANQQKVSVHTVGFGDLSKSKTALKLQVLKTISDKTNGSYQHFTEANVFSSQINAELNKHQLSALLSVDARQLAYGTKSLNLKLELVGIDGQVESVEQRISVTDTHNLDNFLVLISQMFGGKNPWLILSGFGLLFILFISLLIWLKSKKTKKIAEELANKLAFEAQQQAGLRQQNQDMQNALAQVNEKIDGFQPEAPVNEKGTAYGWLKDSNGRFYDLIKYSSTIGRAADSDVVIEDLHISSQHAILDFKKGSFIWTDRAPLNQTYINQQPLSGSAEIKPGDKITCGQTELEFVLAE